MTAPSLSRGQSVRLAAKSLALGDRPAGALLAESRMGAADAFFSLKTYASAILAYYIALRIGLPRPYWSIVTCYIVAQPLAGAVFSKALFRMIGTIVGALVAIIIVPELVNAPELLSGALGLWLALCTYLAMLDRTPRSYVFLLAGYTASIIGFPAVDQPGTVFDIASLRVQEIVIGISASAFVHALVFPRSVTSRLAERTSAILLDAERWSHDALARTDPGMLDRDRRRLALDLHELHQLAIHLPFDVSRLAVRIAVLRVLQERLSLLLPLASGIEDRLAQLRALGTMRAELARFVSDVAQWLAELHADPLSIARADTLIARARALEPLYDAPWNWEAALRLSLLDRLQDLIRVHRDARELRSIIMTRGARGSQAIQGAIGSARAQPLHRDHGLALRAAFATLGTLGIGTAMWIATAWPEGGNAVVIACIVCALYSNLDNPGPTAHRVLYGTITAVPIGAIYAFVILPRTADFPTLAALLAPALLIIGSLLARPKTAPYAIGIMLTLPGLLGLNDRYDAHFQTFANSAVAQIVGVMIAVFMLDLSSAIGARSGALRLVRAGWRELAAMAAGRGDLDPGAWIGRMLDRVAMLAPRLKTLALDPTQPLLDILADTRIGIAITDLRKFQGRATPHGAKLVALLLRHVRRHYAARTDQGPADPDPALIRNIDRLLPRIAALEDPEQRRLGVLALTSLRRNLASSALPPVWPERPAPASPTPPEG